MVSSSARSFKDLSLEDRLEPPRCRLGKMLVTRFNMREAVCIPCEESGLDSGSSCAPGPWTASGLPAVSSSGSCSILDVDVSIPRLKPPCWLFSCPLTPWTAGSLTPPVEGSIELGSRVSGVPVTLYRECQHRYTPNQIRPRMILLWVIIYLWLAEFSLSYLLFGFIGLPNRLRRRRCLCFGLLRLLNALHALPGFLGLSLLPL